jgi:NADH dehydrogenase
MILVVGATGLLGGMIARRLLQQGKEVRFLLRENSPSAELARQGLATSAQSLIAAGAWPTFGDLQDAPSLARAVAGVDAVITTATAIRRGNEADLERVDLQGMKDLIAAARAAGVGHFTFTSAGIADRRSPDRFSQIKAICEQYVRASGLAYTILRPGMFIELWINAVIGIPLRAGRPITLVHPGRRLQSWVAMADVATYATVSLDHPAARNHTLPVYTPRARSWTEAAQAVGRAMGRPLPITYVAPGELLPLVDPGIAQAVAHLETTPDAVVDMAKTSARLGIEPTSLDTAVQRMFAPQRAS